MRLFFARIRDIIARAVKFFTKDIWALDFSELSDARKRMVKNAQAFVLTAKGFATQRVSREAVALSQFTLLAFVPMVAVILFVTDGVGIEHYLLDSLSQSFPSSMPLIEAIRKYADNMVAATQNGAFGWVSFLSFMWSIIWLMLNVGIAFNRIWQVREPRKLWKRLAVSVAIMFVTPFVLVLLFSGWVWYGRFIGMVTDKLGLMGFLRSNLFWLAFYGLVIVALTVMYKFIPHAKVRFGSALKAALIVGIPFVAIQYLYMGTQLMVTRMGAIYGALAFIPLFMIWMNLCWQVILFGAELSRGYTLVDYREARERGLTQQSEYDAIQIETD